MSPKKITFDQADLYSRAIANLFLCSYEKSHLVEDPFVCQRAFCEKLVCKSCYFLINCCPSCGASINSFSNSLPVNKRNMLNQINLSCENKSRGCLVEIDYASYRTHTNNCKYRENSFQTGGFKSSNVLLDAEKAFLLEQMTKNKNPSSESNIKNYNLSANPSQPAKLQEANQEKEKNLENSSSSFVYDFGKKVLSSLASNLGNKILASLAGSDENQNAPEKKSSEPEKKSSKPEKKLPPKPDSINLEDPSKVPPLSSQNSKNSLNFLLNKNPKPKKKVVKNEDLVKFRVEDYEALTIPELKKILSRRNIPKSGNKGDLINKLMMYVEHLKSKGNLPINFYQKQGMQEESEEEEDSESDSSDDEELIEAPSNANNFVFCMSGCSISEKIQQKGF